jgi:hypothetical protein
MATRAQARYEIKAIDKTRRVFYRIGQSLNTMKAQATAATRSLIAVGAAGAIAVGALARKALASAAGLKTLSTQTGVSVEHLQELEAIFARIGMKDRASETIKDVMEALGEAQREPGGTKADAFERLGIEPNKIKNAMQLFEQFSKAYARAAKVGDEQKFLFDVREISNEAGDAIAAIAGDFNKLRDASKGTILDQDTIDRASKSMREWRTLMHEIGQAMKSGILNTEAMKQVQEALTRISKVLGKEGIVGALAEAANILIEKFPNATEKAFEQFAQAKQDIDDIIATKNQLGTAIGTGAGMASEFVRQGPGRDAGVMVEILRQLLAAALGTEKNTAKPTVSTAG